MLKDVSKAQLELQRKKRKSERKKNPCLTGAATTGSFFIATAADSALKGVAD